MRHGPGTHRLIQVLRLNPRWEVQARDGLARPRNAAQIEVSGALSVLRTRTGGRHPGEASQKLPQGGMQYENEDGNTTNDGRNGRACSSSDLDRRSYRLGLVDHDWGPRALHGGHGCRISLPRGALISCVWTRGRCRGSVIHDSGRHADAMSARSIQPGIHEAWTGLVPLVMILRAVWAYPHPLPTQ